MKSDRVAILMMIMLGFEVILSIEAKKLPCPAECALECFASEDPYPVCFAKCLEKCNNSTGSTGSTGANNCISKCGVNKTITATIGTYFLNQIHIIFFNVFILYNSTNNLFYLIYNGFYVSDARGYVTDVVDSCLRECSDLKK